MNRNPNNRNNGYRQTRPQQPQGTRPPLTPQQIAARRAYIERRRRQIRRNRIILGCAAAVVLILLILLVSLIVRGIAGVLSDGDSVSSDTAAISGGVTDTVPGGMQTSDTAGADGTDTAVDTDTEALPEPSVDLSYEGMAFTADLKDFEKYMNPVEDRDAYLILVNAANPLSADDVPDDLVEVVNTRTDRDKQLMRSTAQKALEALYIEAQAQGMMSPDTPSGYPLSVTSAYRSYNTQRYTFSTYVDRELAEHPGWTREQAEAEVLTYSCREGTSEHQTGLCCDMHTLSGADVSFADYEQAEWLAENCWKFGYILRFPKDKVAETGISYEPWHFRYVGQYHAYRIWSQGLCLEEYIAQLSADAS
ncbi:MAG: M15 family metallopeptidase [Clostridia bacterium]|nr:M15 family metallopeptidase [Clostridia bacterium]